MRLLLFGPPGAGKSTQGIKISQYYDVDFINVGELLRDNRNIETKYGKPKEYMMKGELVPKQIVNRLVKEALNSSDDFVLDGFPRTLSQAKLLTEISNIEFIFFLNVDDETAIKRMLGRQVCRNCGDIYHNEYNAPKVSNTCDRCGSEIHQRTDDDRETANKRLDRYKESTLSVANYLRKNYSVVEIDANPSIDEVFAEIQDRIDEFHPEAD